MSYKVPLKTTDPSEGSITYMASRASLEAAEGFFSFTYYIRDSGPGKDTPLYLKGISYYSKLLGRGPFTNWKIVLFTDIYSYKEIERIKGIDLSTIISQHDRYSVQLKQQYYNSITSNPNIVFAIVDWPKHERRRGVPQINGGALRPLRSRLPFDFPNKYVFIRDADTFFEHALQALDFGGLYRTEQGEYDKEGHNAAKEKFGNFLYEWETKFFESIPAIQERLQKKEVLIIGTGTPHKSVLKTVVVTYKRVWHSNELLNKDSPLGVFAGLVGITPGIPVFQDYSAWNDFIDYVDARSVKSTTTQSKLEKNYILNRAYKNSIPSATPIDAEKYLTYRKERVNRFTNKAQGEEQIKKLEEELFHSFSNNGDPHSIGRDEQLYLFILMPRSFDNLFMFGLEYDVEELPVLNFDDDDLLKKTYKEALNAGFKKGKGGTRKRKQQRKTRKNMKRK